MNTCIYVPAFTVASGLDARRVSLVRAGQSPLVPRLDTAVDGGHIPGKSHTQSRAGSREESGLPITLTESGQTSVLRKSSSSRESGGSSRQDPWMSGYAAHAHDTMRCKCNRASPPGCSRDQDILKMGHPISVRQAEGSGSSAGVTR